MPMIKKRNTMTANGTASPLNGDTYEIMQFDGLVEFAILADTGATVNATVNSGADILVELAQIDILAVASPIIDPDHYALKDIAGRGERLKVLLQEAAGGTPIVRTQVKLTQVA